MRLLYARISAGIFAYIIYYTQFVYAHTARARAHLRLVRLVTKCNKIPLAHKTHHHPRTFHTVCIIHTQLKGRDQNAQNNSITHSRITCCPRIWPTQLFVTICISNSSEYAHNPSVCFVCMNDNFMKHLLKYHTFFLSGLVTERQPLRSPQSTVAVSKPGTGVVPSRSG